MIEYDKFWDNLILGKGPIAHFITISIAQYMYLCSGHNRSTPFADFLLKTTSPSSLQSADMKIVPDPEANILFLFFLAIILSVFLRYFIHP